MIATAPDNLPNDRLLTHESAAAMRERLRVMGLSFADHQAAFAELNPYFGGPDFLAGLQVAAEYATKQKDHDTRVAAGMGATQAELAALADCRRRCQALFYAIRQTWPATTPFEKATQETHLKAFGQPKYAAAREQPARLVALIEQAALAFQELPPADATQLAAKGWAALQQTALVTSGAALAGAGATQGHQSGVNAGEAAAYYLAQNQLYWFGQQLSEAAELVFADEPKTRDLFRVTPTGPERFTMTLKPGQRKAVHLDSLLAPTRVLRFSVQAAPLDLAKSAARLWVDFLPAEDAPVEQRVYLEPTLKGQTQKLVAGALGEAGPWLAIENLTDTEAVVKGVVGE